MMPDAPVASIIINNYNYGRFVSEAIESALNQTYRSTEVIVVDDGSSDNSQEIIRSFGDRIVPVCKANGGQGSAYNAGYARARGEVVCFLDADDTVAPEAIETAVAHLRDPGIVKVQWPLRVVDSFGTWSGELSTKMTPPAGDLLQRVIDEGPLYDFYYTTGAAYRRSFLTKVFPVPEPDYRNGSDVYLLTLAPVFGKLLTNAQPLGTYRAHGKNNYRDRSLDDAAVRDCLRRFEANASALRRALATTGVQADVAQWKQRNFNYLWPRRMLEAKQDIQATIPAGSSYVFVNGNEWGAGEPVAGRTSFQFIEREGDYWGSPSTDQEALVELEHLRNAGATYMAFWWTTFWWFEQYPKLCSWLNLNCPCVLSNERLMIFDISDASRIRPIGSRIC